LPKLFDFVNVLLGSWISHVSVLPTGSLDFNFQAAFALYLKSIRCNIDVL
jgi:hypothetical protein